MSDPRKVPYIARLEVISPESAPNASHTLPLPAQVQGWNISG